MIGFPLPCGLSHLLLAARLNYGRLNWLVAILTALSRSWLMTVTDVMLGDIIPMSFSPRRASQYLCWVKTVSAMRVVVLQAQQTFVAVRSWNLGA